MFFPPFSEASLRYFLFIISVLKAFCGFQWGRKNCEVLDKLLNTKKYLYIFHLHSATPICASNTLLGCGEVTWPWSFKESFQQLDTEVFREWTQGFDHFYLIPDLPWDKHSGWPIVLTYTAAYSECTNKSVFSLIFGFGNSYDLETNNI